MQLAFFSPADMLVVMAIALIVFGPNKLPEVGRQIGGLVRELRKTMSQLSETIEGVHGDVRGVFIDPASAVPMQSGRVATDGELMKPYAPPVSAQSTERAGQDMAVSDLGAAAESPSASRDHREERAPE
jgi:TatA/E family protein of Tat protein translocase